MYIEEAKVKDDIAREAESDADRAQREEMERIEREAEEALAMEKAKRIAEEEMKRVLRARDLKAHEAREVREKNASFADVIFRYKRSFYQDRLGSNIGTALNKRRVFSYSARSAGSKTSCRR